MVLFFDGIWQISWWGCVIYVLITSHISLISVSIFLHRHLAHRALDLHPVLGHFFRFWLWLTTGIPTQQWVAVHRKHHAAADTEEDPHSPHIEGLFQIVFFGYFYYVRARKNKETIVRYGHGTPDDWLEREVYSPPFRGAIGLILYAVSSLLLFGIPVGIVVIFTHILLIPILAGGVINGLAHAWGYRNYQTNEKSRNLLPWGIFVAGEELHNNHHKYPSSPKFSKKWWEADVSWWWICLFSFFKLVRLKKVK